MEGVDAQVEEVHVAVAVGHAGEASDFVVDAFHDPGADRVVEVAEDLPRVGQHRVGEFLQRPDGCCVGFEHPVLQILLRRFFTRLIPELAHFLFEVVGFGERFVVGERLLQLRAPVRRQVFPAVEQQVARAFDELLPVEFQCALQAPAYLVDLFVGQLDDVEPTEGRQPAEGCPKGEAKRQQLIENEGRVGQVLVDGAPISPAHVAGHRFDLRVAASQPPPEAFERLLATSFAHPQHAPALQIDHQGHILGLLSR